MSRTQPVANRAKGSAVVTQELHRKLFLERMERKLAFKEAIYNKLYRRQRPRASHNNTLETPIEGELLESADFLRVPSE